MNRIKLLRRENGIKQTDLANFLKVAQNTLSTWENDVYEPDFTNLKKIAEYFETTSDYIIGLSDNPVSPNKKEEHQSGTMSDVQELYDLLISIGVKEPNKKLSPKAKDRLFKLIKNNTNLIIEADEKSE